MVFDDERVRDACDEAWQIVLSAVPTSALQKALEGREGVTARFIAPGESVSIDVDGACWVTVNRD